MNWLRGPWARAILFTLAFGLLLGLAGYTASEGRLWDDQPSPPAAVSPSYPAPATAGSIGTNTQIPYWLGFYARPLWDRYPLYYCLAGQGWSEDDHNAAADGLTNAWGWAKINRTIATQVQERCDEMARVAVRFVMDSAFVQNNCQPNTSFTVVACVSFDDWKWLDEAQAWSYGTATVHVEPYWWARSNHAWKELIFIHEFGHAGLGLNDTPAQACGVTVMDYTYEVSCGMLVYPTGADIAVTNALYGPYRDPAWFCGIGGCPQRK